MSKNIYRKEAVDQMISAEELDQAPQNLLFQGWLLLLLSGVFLMAAVLFSFVVEVPISVRAPGIMWTPEGVHKLMVNTNGVVKDILVTPSKKINKGDVIAIVEQSDLQLEYSSLEQEFESIQKYITHLEKLNLKDERLRRKFTRSVTKLRQASNKRYKDKEARLSLRENELKMLHEKGHIEEDHFNQLTDQLSDTREQMGSLQRDQSSQIRENRLSNLQIQKELLTQKRQGDQVRQQLSTLKKKILDKGQVIAPFAGTIVEIAADIGDYLAPGQPLVIIQPVSSSEELQALIYATFQDGTKMRNGMQVEIELSAYSKAKYGVVKGTIKSISKLPSSTEGMMRTLKNDQLVQFLSGEGAPFKITVDLNKDWKDKSGFEWSSRSNEVRILSNGMMCDAKVITRYKKLKDLFFDEVF